jgi:hypothetical protein
MLPLSGILGHGIRGGGDVLRTLLSSSEGGGIVFQRVPLSQGRGESHDPRDRNVILRAGSLS